MREYILPSHKAFIKAIQAGPSVRKFGMFLKVLRNLEKVISLLAKTER